MTASPGAEGLENRASVIITPDQRVRVFISSTLEELAEERAAALRAIRRLHLVPVWYESGARPHPPQSMYRAYLEQSQIFVGIYWQRYGWVGPGMEISGLEDEYRLAAGKPMLLYLKRPAPDREPGLTGMIDSIRAAGATSYRHFGTARELERLLVDDLAVLLSESFAGASISLAAPHRSPAVPVEPDGAELPAGTLTFLLTDIEGSSRLWESEPEAMEVALHRHDRLLAGVIEEHGGMVVISRGEGDSFFAFFSSAVSAVEAAGDCQLRLGREAWPTGTALRVRMGLHTGEVRPHGGEHLDYGPINRCARVRAAGHGGQVLLTKATSDLVAGRLGDGFGLRRLGEFRLRDLAEPELIYQLDHADLPVEFPPIRTLADRTGNVPLQVSSFIGRAQEVEETAAALGQARLVTLTGPGGIGKTRLAMAVGERLRNRFGAGMVFVPLAAVSDSDAGAGRHRPGGGRRPCGGGVAAAGAGRVVRRRPVAADLGQPGAGGERRRRPGRAAGPLPWRGDPGHQPHGAGAARRAGVPGAAAAAAGRAGHDPASGTGVCAGGGAVCGPRPGGASRLRADPRQRGGGGGDLPAAGGPAAGDRAGGRPHPAAGSCRAARPAGRLAGRAGHRSGRPARAATHPAGHGGVERGPAR